MLNFLANIPWLFILIVAGIGAVLFYTGNSQNQTKLRSVGLVIFALAVLMGCMRFLIDTDAEKMERRTRAIIDAVDRQDWPAVQRMLDKRTSLDAGSVGPSGLSGADAIVAEATKDMTKWQVKEVSVAPAPVPHPMRVEQIPPSGDDPGMIIVTVTVAAVTQGDDPSAGRPVFSGWEFDWRPDAGDYYLDAIKLLSIGDQNVQ